MRDPPKTTPTRPKISRSKKSLKNASIGSDITSLLKNKLLWYNNMYRFGLIFSVLGAMSWAPKYLVSELQFSLVYAGFVSVLLMAPGIVGGPLGGATADRIMKRNAPTCLIGTLAYCFIPLYIAFSSMTPLVIIVVFFLYGFFNAFAEAPALAMFDELGFEKRMLGSALGISNFIAQIGGAMAPALFGLAIDLTGSFSYGWTLMGLTPLTLNAFALLLIYEGR